MDKLQIFNKHNRLLFLGQSQMFTKIYCDFFPSTKHNYCYKQEHVQFFTGQQKAHVNSYRRQTVHRGKVDPGVSELLRGNKFPWNYVNRP